MQALDGTSDHEAALTIINTMPEIERAGRWLDGFSLAAALPLDLTERLQVVLDEVLANVIGHGLRDVPAGSREIAMRLRVVAGSVMLEIVDDGPAFDPTGRSGKAPARMTTRQVGGVGLLMVHKLMDKTRFARKGGHNRLTLWKRLPG